MFPMSLRMVKEAAVAEQTLRGASQFGTNEGRMRLGKSDEP